ncbi:hypothetical protein BX600DRAFT_525273 [Xylariales sp. PMI_506]|nr:hypothetical protein BX600DRAFT_525273 [Xylariales sp. PMI_506]
MVAYRGSSSPIVGHRSPGPAFPFTSPGKPVDDEAEFQRSPSSQKHRTLPCYTCLKRKMSSKCFPGPRGCTVCSKSNFVCVPQPSSWSFELKNVLDKSKLPDITNEKDPPLYPSPTTPQVSHELKYAANKPAKVSSSPASPDSKIEDNVVGVFDSDALNSSYLSRDNAVAATWIEEHALLPRNQYPGNQSSSESNKELQQHKEGTEGPERDETPPLGEGSSKVNSRKSALPLVLEPMSIDGSCVPTELPEDVILPDSSVMAVADHGNVLTHEQLTRNLATCQPEGRNTEGAKFQLSTGEEGNDNSFRATLDTAEGQLCTTQNLTELNNPAHPNGGMEIDGEDELVFVDGNAITYEFTRTHTADRYRYKGSYYSTDLEQSRTASYDRQDLRSVNTCNRANNNLEFLYTSNSRNPDGETHSSTTISRTHSNYSSGFRCRRASLSTLRRPSTRSYHKKAPPQPITKEESARKHRIPPNYSLKNWDPSEEPILLLGSAFDLNSLGKWIYDWTVYHHGPATPIADISGELWLLLIQLGGKKKRAESCLSHIMVADDRELVKEFIESGERLMDKLRSLLKRCETPMIRASKGQISGQLGKNSGIEFVETFFGRSREMERTEKFMQMVRLWNLRFDANCDEILRHSKSLPQSTTRITNSHDGSAVIKASPGTASPASPLKESSPGEDFEDKSGEDSTSEFVYLCETTDEETLAENHPLLQEVPALVQIILNQYAAKGPTQKHTQNGQSKQSSNSKFMSSCNASSTQKPRKRGRIVADDEGASADEGTASIKNGKRTRLSDEDSTTLFLACPFYKKDRLKHKICLRDFRLNRIKDVKQHLCRKHMQPQYCPLCGEEFETQADQRAHIRALSCSRRDFAEPEGITEDHKSKFASRVDRKMTMEQQWYSVWDIIFPMAAHPASVYVQGPEMETLLEFSHFLEEEGRVLVANHLGARNNQRSVSSPTTYMDEFMQIMAAESPIGDDNILGGVDAGNEERDLAALFATVVREATTIFIERLTNSGSDTAEYENGEDVENSQRGGTVPSLVANDGLLTQASESIASTTDMRRTATCMSVLPGVEASAFPAALFETAPEFSHGDAPNGTLFAAGPTKLNRSIGDDGNSEGPDYMELGVFDPFDNTGASSMTREENIWSF